MSETGENRPSAFHRDERDEERSDQPGDEAPTSDVTPADLNNGDDQQLASSRSQTNPRDWDNETLRAVKRCHHVAAAHAVGSPMSGIRSTPGGTAPEPVGLSIAQTLIERSVKDRT
jgi:hypothetical protein